MVQHKQANGGKAQRLIVAGCLVERYRDEIRKTSPKSTPSSAPANSKPSSPPPDSLRRGHASNSPFNILPQAQIDRAPSAVHQHSRPESNGAQLQIEQSTQWVPHIRF